jgi:hypothetical protein
MLELLVKHLELLRLSLDVITIILMKWLLVYIFLLYILNILVLDVQSMHLLVDVAMLLLLLRCVLAVHHLLVRLKGHVRNPTIRIRY